MSYNKLKSLVANVEAIETAMKIQVQGRQASSLWILVLHVRSPVLLFPALAFPIPFLYTSIYRFSAAVQPAVD